MKSLNFVKKVVIVLLLSSVVSYADKFGGIYISTSNVQLNIFKIRKNVYLLSADHSKHRSEAGHDWIGTGVLDKGRYIGVFKYPDNDSKYHGFSGYHEIKFTGGNCFLLYGNTGNRIFGPFKFCKQ